ncbi:MAG TPA: CAP domain-containing protein [Solirubrobacteraceae bacterium]|jgi:uncharacterized protein YkwD|nr:CAP domain-containing protein [Solirubrobacteraceae bacterium]
MASVELSRHARNVVLWALVATGGSSVAASGALAASHEGASTRTCSHAASAHEGGGGHGTCVDHRRPVHLAPCSDTTLVPNSSDLAAVRAATVCLVNHARIAHGEAPLHVNTRLQHAAQMHTHSMVFRNYFQHVGPSGQTPASRMRATGYIAGRARYEVGENIGMGTLWLATPRAVFHAWMISPGHRANILDPHFRDTAVAVSAHAPREFAHGQRGAVYTEDFGVIVHRLDQR